MQSCELAWSMLYAEGAAFNGGGEGPETGWSAMRMTVQQRAGLVRAIAETALNHSSLYPC